MAKHIVKCAICGKQFDANIIPYIKCHNDRRYAHAVCAKEHNEKLKKEEQDKANLEEYIKLLLNIETLDARIRKQINQYINEYEYSYSGIQKALIYFYEVKKNDIGKANGGIGIVPYVYREAYEYYYTLWQAQQKNIDKNVDEYIPKVKEVRIPRPEKKIKKRKVFDFLDEDLGEDTNEF